MKNSQFLFRYWLLFLSLCLLITTADSAENQTGESIWTSLIEQGKIDTSLQQFTEAVKANPADALSRAGVAYLSPSRESEEASLDHFLEALKVTAGQPEALLYLYEAVDLASDRESQEKVLLVFDELLQKDLSTDLRDAALFQRAELLKNLGRWQEAKEAYAKLNFLTHFLYIGPFENAEKGGHNRTFEPESKIDLNAEYQAKRRTIGWRPTTVDPYDGFVNLHGFITPSQEATTYLVTSIRSTQDQRCAFRIGHAGAMKVWLNGKLLADVDRYHAPLPDQVILETRLQQGGNTFMVKLSSGEQGKYGMFVRFLTEKRDAVTMPLDMGSATQEDFASHVLEPSLDAAGKLNTDSETLRQIQTVSQAAGAPLHSKLFYWLLLQKLNIVDENDQQVVTALTEFNNTHPSNPLLLRLLGDVEKVPNRRQLAYHTALKIDPEDRQSFLRLLEYYRTSPYATKGFDLIRQWEKERAVPVPARLSEALMLNGAGLREAAYALVQQHKDELGQKALWYLYEWGKSWQTSEETRSNLNEILQRDPDNMAALSALRELDLRMNNEQSLAAYFEQERWINPYSLSSRIDLLRYYLAAHRYDEAVQMGTQALEIAPDSFEAFRLLSTVYHAQGDPENALKMIDEALLTNPSDPWCLQYRELIQTGEKSYAAPYKKEWQPIEIPDTLDLSKANYVRLLEQKIVKVHQNGNSSETYHEAVKILTEAGVRMQQVRGIYYTGDSEEVRIVRARVWKPDGTFYDAPAPERRSTASGADADAKLYGDSFVCILRFPALEKGSVIEVEYEKESKVENIYADYFGDQFFIGDMAYEPSVQSEYVLITPAQRNFYWKYITPNFPASVKQDHIEIAQEPKITETGGERAYHWTFRHLPTLPREPMMPPQSETLPYLKVSTFASWSEMTHWYWNLAREQLIPGAVTKQRITQVIDAYRKSQGIGLEQPLTDWDKVRAVNAFVNTGVRYLGLEFGIHGFKPHKVDEICNAQYGDCKDKAALAVAMLGELGVPAQMAILRTTDRGEIDYELPSLGIFNHAIYYLPNLDNKHLWIDGTATFFDAAELPPGDSGANTLLIQPGGGYEFKRIPYPEAETNGGVYNTTLALDAEGNAKGYRSSDYLGFYNAIVRRSYENQSKAKELVDQMMAGRYPGSQATNLELSDLANYSNAERLAYEMEIPRFAAKQGNTLLAPSTLFEETLARRYTPTASRDYDLALPYPWSKSNVLNLELPKGAAVTLPADHSLENEFGRYVRKAENKDGRITVSEEIVMRPVRVPKEKYQEFREFCRLVDLYQEEKITATLQDS